MCNALRVGGAERFISQLVPALRSRGFDVAVVVLREKGRFFDELEELGISVRFLEVRSRFDLPGIRKVVKEVGSWPHVVVSQGLDAQLVSQLVAWRARARHLTISHLSPQAAISLHRRLLMSLVARWADGVIAVNAVQVPGLVASGFSLERIRVIDNGVPEPGVSRSADEVRGELGLDADAFMALFVATLRPEKRAEVFVEAVRNAHEGEPRIHGVVAGGGTEFDAVADRLDPECGITMLGDRSDVANLIAASDVVCLTSAYEVSPMVILEAMALAKPVVATDVGGIPSIVCDGETGILTPIDEGLSLARALCELARNPVLAAKMGSAGARRYKESFSQDLMVDRYVSALDEQLAQTVSQR